VKAVGSLVPFGFYIDIPDVNIQSGSGINMYLADHAGVERRNAWFYFGSNTPFLINGQTATRATTAGTYEGGHAGSDGVIRDAVFMQYHSLRTQTSGQGSLTLPGNVDTAARITLIAPDDIEIGQTNTFRLRPVWDTVSYQYAWDINGTPLGTTASVSGSVSSVGYFTVRGIAIRSDFTTDTVSRTYSTYLHAVTVSGESQAQTGCPGYWSASQHGGLAPFSYVWNVEGSLYDTGSDNGFQYVPNSSGSLTIQVTVTDSYGSAVTNSMVVNVVSGSCT